MNVKQFYNKNQFIITDEKTNTTVFQSYNSVICEYNKNTNILKIFECWDYSATTLKHFYLFLNDYIPTIYNYLENSNNKKECFRNLLNKKIENTEIKKEY